MTKILKVWILLCLLVGAFTVTASATVVASGECGAEGDNVTWTLDSEGLLTISGTGDMKDYDDADSRVPWYDNRNIIRTVSVDDGITYIGELAFWLCSNLTSVTISNSVISIGGFAFASSGLTNIEIPESVISIGDGAFNDCRSLSSAVIPFGVTSIGVGAFGMCKSLTSIEIPDSVVSIGRSAFSMCINLESVSISKGITSIEKATFNSCGFGSSGLKSVLIPDGVVSIGEAAFYICDALMNVTIPDSVVSIERMAFGGCTTLTDVYYAGTEAQWNEIVISTDRNDPLLSANIHFNTPVLTSTSRSGSGNIALPNTALTDHQNLYAAVFIFSGLCAVWVKRTKKRLSREAETR